MTAATILLVEDDRDIRESMVEALEDAGYAVVSAVDGVDALEQLRRHARPPQLILLDLMMPRMDGVQLSNELSQVEAWAHIPIVVISADAHGHTTANALGALGYLRKPLRLQDLYRTVAQLVTRS